MKSKFISRERDYSVPCIYNITGQEKIVCVIVHGFGGSKMSTTSAMMFEGLQPLGLGVISFDFPAHGDSEVDGEFLRVANCLADMEAAESLARELAQEAEIVYFASSFGAYITLIHLAEKKQRRYRAFLRSAAVSMPSLFDRFMPPEMKAHLETTGELFFDKDIYDYDRDLKLTQGFFDDLKGHDVFTIWQKGLAELHMVHGEADETIPLSDAQSFANMFQVPLTVVPNGDHRLSTPGAPEQVLKLAAEFFLGTMI